MNLQTKYWYLRQFQMSDRLSEDEMRELCTTLEMKYFRKGETIGLENGLANDVFFIKEGTIKIIRFLKDGEELVKDIIKKDEIFGILALLEGESKDEYAVAMEDSLICIIDAKYLKMMMTNNANLNNYIFKLVGDRIQRLERKLASLVYKNADTRIIQFITDYVKEFGVEKEGFYETKNLFTNTEIGRLTSTSRQTVNRVLNDLKANGAIYFDKDIIKIPKEY